MSKDPLHLLFLDKVLMSNSFTVSSHDLHILFACCFYLDHCHFSDPESFCKCRFQYHKNWVFAHLNGIRNKNC